MTALARPWAASRCHPPEKNRSATSGGSPPGSRSAHGAQVGQDHVDHVQLRPHLGPLPGVLPRPRARLPASGHRGMTGPRARLERNGACSVLVPLTFLLVLFSLFAAAARRHQTKTLHEVACAPFTTRALPRSGRSATVGRRGQL
ncbi:unnamed protein product, partial [Prorocentrum cordatum]